MGTPALTWVASPLARERGRVRVAPSESCASRDRTPHFVPLHLLKERDEISTAESTTSEYEHEALIDHNARDWSRCRHRCGSLACNERVSGFRGWCCTACFRLCRRDEGRGRKV